MTEGYKLLFGYTHVMGIPMCPCRDPGNYVAVEQSNDDPLDLMFTCWCGSKMKARADTPEEVEELVQHKRMGGMGDLDHPLLR